VNINTRLQEIQDYKKSNMEVVKDVTKIDKDIAMNLDVEDRVYSTTAKQAFITLKDHKPNFNNNPTCRLLNPSKTEIGKNKPAKIGKNQCRGQRKNKTKPMAKYKVCGGLVFQNRK
jgi:hypothetical protein